MGNYSEKNAAGNSRNSTSMKTLRETEDIACEYSRALNSSYTFHPLMSFWFNLLMQSLNLPLELHAKIMAYSGYCVGRNWYINNCVSKATVWLRKDTTSTISKLKAIRPESTRFRKFVFVENKVN